ncbi:MAG: hypothetical protein ACM3VZ_10720 [Acidobacteriota bacterium]
MFAYKHRALITLLLAPVMSQALAATSSGAPIDNRLVGEWRGQRDDKSACQFQSRSVQRLPDGRYVISYFSDAAQTHKTAEVKGLWWATDKTLFMQSPGSSGKPDAYRYYMIDKNTVRLENVDVDLSADCPEDSTLIDSRVVQE